MRIELDIGDDVLEAALALAERRGVSVGAAVSALARRGLATRVPLSSRNGFPVFQIPAGSPSFGPKEVDAALKSEGLPLAKEFLDPAR